MAHTISATVNDRQYSWEMTLPYDLKKTAFIWVQDEAPISYLTTRLTPSARRGSTVFNLNMKKLFLMKPLAMAALPDWCRTRPAAETHENDTHEWLEIESDPGSNNVLCWIGKPIAIIEDAPEWRVEFEDDYRLQSYKSLTVSNLRGYGLNLAAHALEFVVEYSEA